MKIAGVSNNGFKIASILSIVVCSLYGACNNEEGAQEARERFRQNLGPQRDIGPRRVWKWRKWEKVESEIMLIKSRHSAQYVFTAFPQGRSEKEKQRTSTKSLVATKVRLIGGRKKKA